MMVKKARKRKYLELKKKEQEIKNLKKSLAYITLKTEVLEKVCEAISSPHYDVDKLLGFILDLAMNLVEVEAGSILLIDDETKELFFKATKGEKKDEVKKFRLKIGEGIAGWTVQTGIATIVPDVKSDWRWKREISRLINYPTYSIMCVPLKMREKIIGVIELINKKKGKKFTLEDKNLLTLLATHAAITLQNAELIMKEARRVKDLILLQGISLMISSTLDLKQVLERIMELATELMNAEASSLMLIDEETGDLLFEVAEGEKEEEVKNIKLKLGEGICGFVAKTGKPLLIPDAYKDSRFNPEVDKKTGFKTRSILCVPLKIKEKIIGVVEVLNPIGRKSFEDEDVELFSALASQAAIAIENAKLYEDLKELFLGTVASLVETVDAKSPYTHGHSVRVSEYAVAIANELNLSKEEQEEIRLAGILHDIGKIGVSEEIINKPEKLTDEEYGEIKKHPGIGVEILTPVKQLKNIIPGVKYHQERHDGRGYPDGLKDGNIPLAARILSIADTFDAMTSDRPYRKKYSDEFAVGEIDRCKDSQFDPEVVDAFLKAIRNGRIKEIKEREG